MILGTSFWITFVQGDLGITVLGEEDGGRDERKGMEEGGEESGRR